MRTHESSKRSRRDPGGTTPGGPSSNRFKLAIGIAGIVIVLAILIVGTRLLGTPAKDPVATTVTPTAAGEFQEIMMRITSSGYEPNRLTVEAGKPVRWVVDGRQVTGCTRYLVSSSLGINKRIEAGDNIIEFTPQEKGTFAFSCGMNMVRGTMIVT